MFLKIMIKNRLTPYKKQQESIDSLVHFHWISTLRASLDASDTGTGKTLVAVETSRLLNRVPVVICPAVVVPSWKSMLEDQGVPYYEVISWNKAVRMDTDFYRKIESTNKRSKPKGLWTLPDNAFIIFDECHKAKNYKAKNTEMVRNAVKQGYHIHMMSATPFNSPVEMGSAFYAFGFSQEQGYLSWARFLISHGCYQDHFNAWVFDSRRGGEKILEDIRQHLVGSGAMVRLRREDLKDNFKDNHIHRVCLEYGNKITKMLLAVDDQLAKLYEQMEKDRSSTVLTEILRARQLQEIIKVPLLVDFVKEELDKGNSVVVFLSFSDSIDTIKELLKENCSVVDGRQTAKRREKEIALFQSDENKVILVNLASGGAGVSLHNKDGLRPRVSVISPSYSMVDMIQSLGRIDRAGSWTDTHQYILVTKGTIEDRVATAVIEKQKNLETILNE